jgi:hypothetical protein
MIFRPLILAVTSTWLVGQQVEAKTICTVVQDARIGSTLV